MNPPSVLFVGRATLDVVYSIDHLPSEDTKIFARAMHVAPGGPATNAAITFALLGGRAMLMTAIGGGPWSDPVRVELRQLGIGLVDLAEETSYETPLTTVLASQAHATRTIVNPPPSNAKLRPIHNWDPVWGGEAPELILTDGFHLDEALPLLRSCRAAGAQICLDGGSWKTGTEKLAGLLSIAICGERFQVPGRPPDPNSILHWFAENGVAQVAITRGAKPILGWDRGRTFDIPITEIHAVDTSGAGDVFHGAFCHQFVRSGDFEQALRFGAEIASQSCQRIGIRGWENHPLRDKRA